MPIETFEMSCCDQCYECDTSLCPRAGDRTQNCCLFLPSGLLTARTADGDYEATVRNVLPEQVRSLDGPHIDALVGYTAGAAVTTGGLTREEAAIAADPATVLEMDNAHMAVDIAGKKPAHKNALISALNALQAGEKGAANKQMLNNFVMQIREEARDTAEVVKKKPLTGLEYKQGQYPRATLFATITKSVVRGTEVVEDAREMFDPTTGKKYVPFDKQTKVEKSEHLMYAVHLYVTAMQTMTREAPKVYFDFMRDVTRASERKGPKFGQAYVDAILRYLDEKRYPNMVALFKAGEPTRIYLELEGSDLFKVKVTKPGEAGGSGGRQRIKNFGPVTDPMGGKGAGIINKPCHKFQASPRQPCTHGVPADEGFPADVVGLCVYCH